MLFQDEAEKLQAAREINTCLGNATGQLRGDLLSCCCVCGLLIPTNLIPNPRNLVKIIRGAFKSIWPVGVIGGMYRVNFCVNG